MVNGVRDMYKIYMIIEVETGENKGFYTSDIWKLEDVEAEVEEGQVLKEISKELWKILLRNNEEISINNPIIKKSKITEFLNEDILNWENIKEKVDLYFTEKSIDQESYEMTQTEKDIKVLAEALKTLIEPMIIPEDNYSNQILEKLHEIINRYLID